MLASTVQGANRLFDFEGSEYGANDPVCAGLDFPSNYRPPMFNMAIYGSQTTAYVDGVAACGGGSLGSSPVDFNSYSFLTNYYSFSPSKSEEIRFSWKDPNDGNSWARIITESVSGRIPVSSNPTIDIRPGSSVKMRFLVYLTDVNEVDNVSGNIEVALLVRETGLNYPLGENGGTSGTLEFVGITTSLGATPYAPKGAWFSTMTPPGTR